jgi:hypothetical protein
MTEIASQLVETMPLPDGDGCTFTLTSQLGKMLCLAESRFGTRDKTYTILGIEFINDVPHCWYPGNCGNIIIQLGRPCMTQPDRACFQLAHETIHLLSPTGGRNANVLEEGLASHFQVWYMANHYPCDWPRSGFDWRKFECQSYVRAKSLVEQLLELAPDAIRLLRERQPVLSCILADDIASMFPDLDSDVADALAQGFMR